MDWSHVQLFLKPILQWRVCRDISESFGDCNRNMTQPGRVILFHIGWVQVALDLQPHSSDISSFCAPMLLRTLVHVGRECTGVLQQEPNVQSPRVESLYFLVCKFRMNPCVACCASFAKIHSNLTDCKKKVLHRFVADSFSTIIEASRHRFRPAEHNNHNRFWNWSAAVWESVLHCRLISSFGLLWFSKPMNLLRIYSWSVHGEMMGWWDAWTW